MRRILFLAQAEVLHILRDRVLLAASTHSFHERLEG